MDSGILRRVGRQRACRELLGWAAKAAKSQGLGAHQALGRAGNWSVFSLFLPGVRAFAGTEDAIWEDPTADPLLCRFSQDVYLTARNCESDRKAAGL